MATDDPVINIKYWKCSGCDATFTSREDARAHQCSSTNIVEADGPVAETTEASRES